MPFILNLTTFIVFGIIISCIAGFWVYGKITYDYYDEQEVWKWKSGCFILVIILIIISGGILIHLQMESELRNKVEMYEYLNSIFNAEANTNEVVLVDNVHFNLLEEWNQAIDLYDAMEWDWICSMILPDEYEKFKRIDYEVMLNKK